jgi:tetratricopeptide (TPR) repeat protein
MNDVQTVQKRLKGLLLKRPGFTVALCGPAGIGKTFTVQRLLRETACRNLSVHALTNPSTLARALPRPKKLQAWAERTLESIDAGEFVETKRVVDLIGSMLTGLAPFVLHLEDVHELNAEQLEFVNEIARVVPRLKGVALIVTSRKNAPEPFEGLQLEALSNSDVTVLLEREAGTKLPVDALEWIHARAAGNPLFTLEFFRLLTRQGSLWNDGQRWKWREPPSKTIPTTVEALIEYQLNLVMTGSVLPTALISNGLYAKAMLHQLPAFSLWQEVTGCDASELQAVQNELERYGVLREDQFVHPLIPEVALKVMSAQHKQMLSARVFAVLKTSQPQLATQFMLGARTEPAEMLEVLKKAAESCLDPKRKGQFLYQAVTQAQGFEKTELAWKAAQILQHNDLERALEMCREALQLPDHRAVVDLMATLLARKNDVVALEQLLESTKSEWDLEEVRICSLMTLGRYPEAAALWEANPTLQKTAKADVLYAAALSYLATRQFAPFEALLERVSALSDDSMQSEQRNRFIALRGSYHMDRGEYAAGINEYLTVIKTARENGMGHTLGSLLNNLGLAYKNLGQYDLAQSSMQESIELRSSAGDLRQYAFTLAAMAEIQADMGLQSEAENAIQEALGTLGLHAGSRFHTVGLSAASYVYSQSSEPMAGMMQLKYSSQALLLARDGQNKNLLMEILYDQVMALMRNRNKDEAKRLLEEFASLDALLDSPTYHWRFKKAQAHLQEMFGELKFAKSLFAEAMSVAEGVHDPLNSQKLGLELDRLNNNHRSAQQRLDWFEGKGFLAAAAFARGYFPQLRANPSKNQASPASEIPSNTVKLEVLGPMQVIRDADPEPVRGRKRKQLLALLLEARIAGRNEIHQLELIDTLYPEEPEEPEEQALSSLKQAVRGIRSSLGADAIQTTGNGYALGSVTSDAETFLTSGEVALWRGAYLDGLDRISEDDSIRENLHLSLLAGAQRILESDPETALRAGRILMAFDAYNLEHLALCVRALQLRNNHKSLNRLYQEARAQLLEVAEVIPERWQEFLAARATPTVPH